jgi:N-acetylglucosamine malate deacetylase 1
MPKGIKPEYILIFSAHNDDQIIGAGGTIAKYAKEGKQVIVYIFSFGEKSHPHFHETEIRKTRVKEMHDSDKILNIEQSYFLGLQEGKFPDEFKAKNRKEVIIRALEKYRPTKIFTHNKDDPHPDHRAVNKIIREITKEMEYKGDLYAFDVWNPFSLRGRGRPKLVVNISKTFQNKVQALRCHDSQFTALITMIPSIYARSIVNGLRYGFRYAEKFTKVR